MSHRAGRSAILVACIGVALALPIASRVLVARFNDALHERASTAPVVVGAKGSRFDLVFASLYFRPGRAGTMSLGAFDALNARPGVEALPVHVRFTARGAPVVATGIEYLQRRGLRVERGASFATLGEAVVGAGAAERLALAPGDTLGTDQVEAYGLTAPASIRLRVSGVLAPSGSVDDDAIFVDLETAWLLEGIAHGHQEATTIDRPDLLIGKTDEHVALSGAVVTEQDVADADPASFHIHADRSELPITGALVYPNSEKTSTILRTAINATPDLQAVEPAAVIDELMAFVVRVRLVFDALAGVMGLSTVALVGLISLLSYRVREEEIRTLTEIGCARGAVAGMFGAELGLILALGVGVALSLVWLGVWLVSSMTGLV
ncbi:MAG: ABC transporter permease [Phycisphaerales bacterium JB059]